MNNPVRITSKALLGFLFASLCLLAHNASATLSYWDPQGLWGSYNLYTGNLAGTWENTSWARNSTGGSGLPADQGTNNTLKFTENDAAVFCVGAGSTNLDAASTVNFSILVNSNHTIGGFFDGPLNPRSCIVNLYGPGKFTLPAILAAVDLSSSSDNSIATINVSNVIAGTGILTLEGIGTLTLYGTNTYSGGTYFGYSGASAGVILNLGSPYCLGTGSIVVSNGNGSAITMVGNNPLTITNAWSFPAGSSAHPNLNIVGNPAGLTFSGPWTLTGVTPNIGSGNANTNVVIFSGVMSGTGGLSKDHTGNLILSATNTYTGVTTVTNGTLQLGDGTNRNGVVAGTITTTSPGTLIYANPNAQTNSKVISGTGAVIKQAGGLLTLSVVNTYSGTTTITNGSTIKQTIANALPSGSGKGDLYLFGTLDINGLASGVQGLNGTGTIDSLTNNTASTLTIGNNNASGSFSGVIQNTAGSVAVTKTGTGTETFATVNTYSGNTTVSGGTLQNSADNVIPAASSVVINSNSIWDLFGFNDTVAAISGPGTLNSLYATLNVVGNANTGSTQNFNGYSCLSGPINSIGGTLTKGGTGAMAVRTSLAAFNGSIVFNQGVFSVGDAPNLLPTSMGLTVPSSGLFQLDANAQEFSSLSGSGAINLGGGKLTVDSGTYGGVVQNSELPGSSTAAGNGLRGYYYTNIDFTGLGAVRDDSTINLTNMTYLPNYSPTAKTNQISIRWLGQVLTTIAGNYTFTTFCDDGSRLWVNGVLLVNNWTTGGAAGKSAVINLAADTKYDIVLEYFNNTAGGEAVLLWTPPNDTGSWLIPSANLFLPAAGTLVCNGGLQLTSANTYSGGSLVTAGTLEASAAGLGTGNATVSDNSKLQLDSPTTIASVADLILSGNNSTVNLNFTGTNTIHGLSLDGGANYAVPGVWGAPGSGAPHQNGLFSGSGYLKVTASASLNSLVASASTAVYGTSVTFTSTITGFVGTPTGTVSFYDGANFLGSAPLSGGVATLSVNNLLVDFSPHSITAVYSGDTNYATSTSGFVSVSTTPATITPIIVAASKVYDTTTNATIASVTFGGILPSDTNYVHLTTAYTNSIGFTDPYVGTNKTVNISGLAITGSLVDNYILSTNAVSTTANITAKPLFVTGLTATNKVYNATTVDGVTGTAALSGVISPDSVTLSGTPVATFVSKNVGTAVAVILTGYTIPSTGIATNYALTLTNLSANITAFPTTVTGVTANNKTYDGTTAATLSGTPTLTPAAFGGDLVNISGPTNVVFTNAAVGLRGVTVTGYILTNTDAGNYSLSQPTGLSATISQANTTATLTSTPNPSLPGTNVTFTYTLTSTTPSTTSPTGTVSFITNGFNSIPAITLVPNGAGSAKATFITSGLNLGNNTVNAQYSGDSNYAGPANASTTQVVQNGACSATNNILGIVYNGGNSYTITFVGTPSAQYYVIAQTNVGAPLTNWTVVPNSTNTVVNTNGTWTFTVTNAAPAFYLSKAVQPCP